VIDAETVHGDEHGLTPHWTCPMFADRAHHDNVGSTGIEPRLPLGALRLNARARLGSVPGYLNARARS